MRLINDTTTSASRKRSCVKLNRQRTTLPGYCKLARIQFNNQRFVHVRTNFVTGRNILESAFQFLGVNGNPVGQTVGLGQFQGFGDANLILSLLTDGDNITGLNGVGRNIYLVAVNADSSVGN